MPVEKSAGAIIFRKEKGKILYLLIQAGLGHWDFPKGWIEKGEGLEGAARREVEEETGLKDLTFLAGFKETIKYFFQFQGKKILKFVTYFLAETKTKEIKLSYEHQDFKWASFKEALELLAFKNTREIFKKAHQFLNKKLKI